MSQDYIYHDSIILGAGASGLMCAYRYHDRDIALIDANSDIAAKIKISGGGKCNVTNISVKPSHFVGDKGFIQESLQHFSKEDLRSFCQEEGLRLVLKKGRYYFCPHTSEELIAIFRKALKHTKFYLREKILSVKKEKELFSIQTDQKRYRCKDLIVATGGLSYPRIGASSIGYEIAKGFGHTIVTPKPALVGLTVQKEQFWFKELSGLSVEVRVKVGDKIFQDDMLFTHKGISGPVILNASLYWEKGEIEIDFLPKISYEKLLKLSKKKMPLPKRFYNAFLERYPQKELKAYRFAPAGNFGYSKAEVTRGGVCTNEINPKTMESMKEKNLFFIGECLDVTGELGGYNFQWAFSSAQMLRLGR